MCKALRVVSVLAFFSPPGLRLQTPFQPQVLSQGGLIWTQITAVMGCSPAKPRMWQVHGIRICARISERLPYGLLRTPQRLSYRVLPDPQQRAAGPEGDMTLSRCEFISPPHVLINAKTRESRTIFLAKIIMGRLLGRAAASYRPTAPPRPYW